ncbi:hypothetical protein F5887DRAFT_1160207 [Amanita rubescens]|nr:hypothetical protein F5887DRAFT_1160207 [Amanita rubescens]
MFLCCYVDTRIRAYDCEELMAVIVPPQFTRVKEMLGIDGDLKRVFAPQGMIFSYDVNGKTRVKEECLIARCNIINEWQIEARKWTDTTRAVFFEKWGKPSAASALSGSNQTHTRRGRTKLRATRKATAPQMPPDECTTTDASTPLRRKRRLTHLHAQNLARIQRFRLETGYTRTWA